MTGISSRRDSPITGATTPSASSRPTRATPPTPPTALREFKEMVARFHDAGLEVILDVVYNHTAEGNERGPTLSFKGIDNASYYRLMPDKKRYYINDTGTGNTVNLSHPRVIADGDRQPALLGAGDACRRLPLRSRHHPGARAARLRRAERLSEGRAARIRVLATVKLIAEPWDCGPGGYQVGRFPPGWAEWNDKFRDTVRDFWRGEAPAGDARAAAVRVGATCSTTAAASRGPASTSSPLTTASRCNDLVSYNDKHNEANGEDNKDGTSDNRSWNCGARARPTIPTSSRCAQRQMRNMLATLLLVAGHADAAAGDEFGRTQQGNNNAYCQDNEISWLDWDVQESGRTLSLSSRR